MLGGIAIDSGHGQQEFSIKHYDFIDANFRADEWRLNRAVAWRVLNKLLQHGKFRPYDVVSDVFLDERLPNSHAICADNVSLAERIRRVNSHPDIELLVSIHHNLFYVDSPSGNGTDVRGAMFGIGRNAGNDSERCAKIFADRYRQSPLSQIIPPRVLQSPIWTNRPDTMLDKRDWDMMTKTNCSALTTEIGFYSNLKEARLMTTYSHQEAEAQFIFDSIRAALPEVFNEV